MTRNFSKVVMSQFSPEKLLSSSSREYCVKNISELPSMVSDYSKFSETASVLVPLCVVDGEVSLLYTLRSLQLKSHSGQVSFPGGKTDPNETVLETALRETEEELGLSRDKVDVWAQMPSFQGRNEALLITPIVGLIKNFNFSELTPSQHEVEKVFTVPMRVLCDPSNHAHLLWKNNMLPIYLHEKYKIWGITGFITHMFLGCLLHPEDYNVDFMREKFEFEDLLTSKL